MTLSSSQETYLVSRRLCKIILIVGTALLLGRLITFGLSRWEGYEMLRFEGWLSSSGGETFDGISGLLFGTMLLLLCLCAPRCPNCRSLVPQFGMDGDPNVGPDAKACRVCHQPLPQ